MLYGLIKNLPKSQAMAVGLGGSFALSYVCFAVARYTGPDLGGDVPGSPKTMSAEWQAATVEYNRAQNANPIRHFRG
ncbi:TPA: hypothetical protein N0F65_000768 [Lagenidium giganteum]|uniref:Uncharacterized protein n=1 Tax=Lagenidium giganteum TaxID=4803 RepID=A0AAV2ZHQ0_9STRA|nr:TPA: hypothetical protein N0F65_000768 [Lagenidium giganteum]